MANKVIKYAKISLTAATAAMLTMTLTPASALASSTSSTHSVTQLQKELATLGYLPLTSSFQWRYSEPSSLKSLWKSVHTMS